MSKSAIRAARALANGGWIPSRSSSRVAQIIEEETGLLELLEACKKANTCASLPDCVRELCRAAIAQAEGR